MNKKNRLGKRIFALLLTAALILPNSIVSLAADPDAGQNLAQGKLAVAASKEAESVEAELEDDGTEAKTYTKNDFTISITNELLPEDDGQNVGKLIQTSSMDNLFDGNKESIIELVWTGSDRWNQYGKLPLTITLEPNEPSRINQITLSNATNRAITSNGWLLDAKAVIYYEDGTRGEQTIVSTKEDFENDFVFSFPVNKKAVKVDVVSLRATWDSGKEGNYALSLAELEISATDVSEAKAVESISENSNVTKMEAGGTAEKIEATISPDDATNKNFFAESSDEETVRIEAVRESGNTVYKAVALQPGTATITVHSCENVDIKDTYDIEVAFDRRELAAVIDVADKKQENNYKEGWEAFSAKLAAAKEIQGKEITDESLTQEAVDTALAELKAAMQELQLKDELELAYGLDDFNVSITNEYFPEDDGTNTSKLIHAGDAQWKTLFDGSKTSRDFELMWNTEVNNYVGHPEISLPLTLHFAFKDPSRVNEVVVYNAALASSGASSGGYVISVGAILYYADGTKAQQVITGLDTKVPTFTFTFPSSKKAEQVDILVLDEKGVNNNQMTLGEVEIKAKDTTSYKMSESIALSEEEGKNNTLLGVNGDAEVDTATEIAAKVSQDTATNTHFYAESSDESVVKIETAAGETGDGSDTITKAVGVGRGKATVTVYASDNSELSDEFEIEVIDRVTLKNLCGECEAAYPADDKDQYTEKSWNALQAALTSAKTSAEKPLTGEGAVTQEELDEKQEALEKAMDNVIPLQFNYAQDVFDITITNEQIGEDPGEDGVPNVEQMIYQKSFAGLFDGNKTERDFELLWGQETIPEYVTLPLTMTFTFKEPYSVDSIKLYNDAATKEDGKHDNGYVTKIKGKIYYTDGTSSDEQTLENKDVYEFTTDPEKLVSKIEITPTEAFSHNAYEEKTDGTDADWIDLTMMTLTELEVAGSYHRVTAIKAPADVTIAKDQEVDVNVAEFTPANATIRTFKAESDKPEFVRIDESTDENGKTTYKAVGVAEGTATITLTSLDEPEGDEAVAATYKITVSQDKEELIALINECKEKYKESKYTEDTWKVYAEALRQAEQARDAADTTADDIQAVIAALQEAVSQLKEKPVDLSRIYKQEDFKITMTTPTQPTDDGSNVTALIQQENYNGLFDGNKIQEPAEEASRDFEFKWDMSQLGGDAPPEGCKLPLTLTFEFNTPSKVGQVLVYNANKANGYVTSMDAEVTYEDGTTDQKSIDTATATYSFDFDMEQNVKKVVVVAKTAVTSQDAPVENMVTLAEIEIKGPGIPPASIKAADTNKKTLKIGEQSEIEAVFTPENVTNKSFTVESNKPDIVKIVESDGVNKVEGVKVGKATITITATANEELQDSYEIEVVVNKDALAVAIGTVESLQEKDYTAESWTALQTVLASAKAVNENADATQEQIDNALTALNAAVQALVHIADKSDLQMLYDSVKDKKNEGYAEEDWKAFTDALDAAKTVLDKTEPTQEEVDNAKNALQAAIDGLQKPEVELPFVDIPDWGSTDIKGMIGYLYEKGLMKGYTNEPTKFVSMDQIIRGDFALVLYRMYCMENGEKEKTIKEDGPLADNPFPDVAKDAHYAYAVKWASENKIVTGYTSGAKAGCFDPLAYINREQVAVMLYRYAKFIDEKLIEGVNEDALEGFTDKELIQPYSDGSGLQAMKWAVSKDIIQGMNKTTLNPMGGAVRAQTAAMFYRYLHQDEWAKTE